jgi:molybdenum cofactor cytidylyltransferase
MKYGTIPLDQASGAVLAHSIKPAGAAMIRKGTVLGEAELANLRDAGIDEVPAAVLEPGDIGEDEAASRLAEALAGRNIRTAQSATGRVNLYATKGGLFVVDRDRVDRINAIDAGITLATLSDLKSVGENRMVATVKIIPYAVARSSMDAAVEVAREQVIAIEPYTPRRIGVVATVLPQLKASVMDKTIRVLRDRLASSGSTVGQEIRTAHDEAAVAAAIAELLPGNELVLVYGASAICDINDVIPAAVRAIGGRIEHFGMPVDPGNLLMVAEVDGKPVIGTPGCARSPAENGFDWILQRLIAGRKVTAQEIARMGVGGLLMEIESRPQPREPARAAAGKVAAIILAAGQSRRMGRLNKLTARLGGKPMIRHVVEAALASRATPTVVVTGHQANAVREALDGTDVTFVANPRFAAGLSTSLAAGIAALPEDCDGALVLLGDMPLINGAMIDRLVDKFVETGSRTIVLATFNGKRGNPVLWPRQFFERLQTISGDVGARHLVGENTELTSAVELGEAAGRDIDTPQMLREAIEQTS